MTTATSLFAATTCESCGGSGRCAVCDGVGTAFILYVCAACAGSGRCYMDCCAGVEVDLDDQPVPDTETTAPGGGRVE